MAEIIRGARARESYVGRSGRKLRGNCPLGAPASRRLFVCRLRAVGWGEGTNPIKQGSEKRPAGCRRSQRGARWRVGMWAVGCGSLLSDEATPPSVTISYELLIVPAESLALERLAVRASTIFSR